MLAYLIQRAKIPEPPAASLPDQRLPDLSAIGVLLSQSLGRKWRVDALARLAGYSKFHFLRLFRQTFHETPYAYLLSRRLDEARRLLESTALSVTEICFRVGFESLGSFSSVFRREVGRSPSAYRARVRAQRQRPLEFVPACHVGRYRLAERSQFSRSLSQKTISF